MRIVRTVVLGLLGGGLACALSWQPGGPTVAADDLASPTGAQVLLVDDPHHPGRLHLLAPAGPAGDGQVALSIPAGRSSVPGRSAEVALCLAGVVVLAGAGLGAGTGTRTRGGPRPA